MKEIKLKKNIPADAIVIVISINGKETVQVYNKKFKIKELKTTKHGILVFNSIEGATSFLGGVETTTEPAKEVKPEVKPENKSKERKLQPDGNYNIPITLEFRRGTTAESKKLANEFVKRTGFGGGILTHKTTVKIEIKNKSKRSIMNKVKKFAKRDLFKFENLGKTIIIK